MSGLTIRPVEPADIDELCEIEVEAGRLFLTVDMPEVAGDVPDAEGLARAQVEGRAWLATEHDVRAGYVVASIVDGNAHIDQVSVRPRHSGRGIGRRLIEHVEAWGNGLSLRATTLTTFRDVPWNAPYYERLGYRRLEPHEIGPELEAIMEHEATLPGLEPALRCAMLKANRHAGGYDEGEPA
jgi:ribosomal protein S18 acetylase RimI-like enzyme